MSETTFHFPDSQSITASFALGKLQLDGQPIDAEVIKVSDYEYFVFHNNTKYHLFIHNISPEGTCQVEINNSISTLRVETKLQKLLNSLGMSAAASIKPEIKAPMPGLVLKVLVAAGEEVTKDQPLLVLEAMKMENVIKAPANVTIDKILVEVGKPVEKNAVLVRFKS